VGGSGHDMLFRNCLQEQRGDHIKPRSVYSVPGPTFETETSRIHVSSFTTSMLIGKKKLTKSQCI
jgi:hypothetical protein